jgi:hypothetical protein
VTSPSVRVEGTLVTSLDHPPQYFSPAAIPIQTDVGRSAEFCGCGVGGTPGTSGDVGWGVPLMSRGSRTDVTEMGELW